MLSVQRPVVTGAESLYPCRLLLVDLAIGQGALSASDGGARRSWQGLAVTPPKWPSRAPTARLNPLTQKSDALRQRSPRSR